jgi:vitamin B12 transporter
MKHLLLSASALALVAQPITARAQDTFDLGEVVVFANQTETQSDRIGVTVETLTQDDLAASPTNSAATALQNLPGVSVASSGGLGKLTSLRIRGLPDRYVGVRINGIDVTDPSRVQTQYNWSGLTTAGLSSIEVLKGSQSALFGSEAIAGVINITTFRPTEMGTTYRFGAEVGSFNTKRADFSVGTKTERAELALTLSHIDTDGFSAADENAGNTEDDGYTGTTVLLSARYQASDQIALGFEGIYQDEETNIDASGGAGGDADRPNFTKTQGMRIFAEIDTGAFMHEAGVSYFKTDRNDPLTPFGSPTFEGRRTEFTYKAKTDLASGPLVFGAEYSQEEADFSNGAAEYDNYALFAEHSANLSDDVDLTVSGRVDDHSQFGTAVTGRAALAWRIGHGSVLRASVGTGYRAPSLNELFGPFNFTVANPVLDAEESRTAEIGIEHRYDSGAQVKATAFYTEIDNLIGYAGGNYVQTPGTSTSQGIELSGRVPVTDRVSVFANYTFTDAVDATGAQLARVPEHDFVVGLEAAITDQLSTQFVLNHVANRVDGFPSGPVPDYTVVNATLNFAITETNAVYLRVENLFDEEYQTAAGYGTSDRAVYFGIRASF